MASLNMAKVNTLIRKGYLFAGVIIAANIFVGNEMKAMNPASTQNNQQSFPGTYQPNTYLNHDTFNSAQKIEGGENKDVPVPQPKEKFFDILLFKFLSWEGRINFFGGLVFSVANNYLKWWDYNPGWYCNLRIGCLGLRSKRFLNGMLQFEGNLNLIRGTLWLIPGVIDFLLHFMGIKMMNTNTATWIMIKILNKVNENNKTKFVFFYSIFFLVQGFVSIPLTLHFSKFSISISLDSLIWGITGMILEKKLKPNNHNIEEDILLNKKDEVDVKDEDNNKVKEDIAGETDPQKDSEE